MNHWVNIRILFFFRPRNEATEISKTEKILEIKFPISYKNFLAKYGYLSFEGVEVYGLYNSTIIKLTTQQREVNKDPKFPHSFIPIHAELSCLDTSQMNAEGECPAVAWYFGVKLPNGKYEVLAEDFGAFLLDKVKLGVESLEEQKN